MIYLDSAATSLWHPKEAEERMIQALRGCGNAGRGAHDATLDAGRIVFETRMRLAELFHAESPERIAFTVFFSISAIFHSPCLTISCSVSHKFRFLPAL